MLSLYHHLSLPYPLLVSVSKAEVLTTAALFVVVVVVVVAVSHLVSVSCATVRPALPLVFLALSAVVDMGQK